MMRKIKEDFIQRFGESVFEKVVKLAGHHSKDAGFLSTCSEEELEMFEHLSEEEKLIFSLLEMLDFECFNFNKECNVGLTEKDIKKFLLDHRDVVLSLRIPPPSFIGLIAGTFDFLLGDEDADLAGRV